MIGSHYAGYQFDSGFVERFGGPKELQNKPPGAISGMYLGYLCKTTNLHYPPTFFAGFASPGGGGYEPRSTVLGSCR